MNLQQISRAKTDKLHQIIDSTGLKLKKASECQQDEHGTGKSRGWRKVHIGTAAGSSEIVAFDLTGMDMDGAAHVNNLLDQIGLASVMGDGAYDRPVCMAS